MTGVVTAEPALVKVMVPEEIPKLEWLRPETLDAAQQALCLIPRGLSGNAC